VFYLSQIIDERPYGMKTLDQTILKKVSREPFTLGSVDRRLILEEDFDGRVSRQSLETGESRIKLTLTSGFRECIKIPKEELTKPLHVEVYGLLKDSNFEAIFGAFPKKIDELCLNQAQIIQFHKEHRFSLRGHGVPTLFATKIDGELSVVNVTDYKLVWFATIFSFSDHRAWFAQGMPNVVVPQITAKP
jgi:hypothetical protein